MKRAKGPAAALLLSLCLLLGGLAGCGSQPASSTAPGGKTTSTAVSPTGGEETQASGGEETGDPSQPGTEATTPDGTKPSGGKTPTKAPTKAVSNQTGSNKKINLGGRKVVIATWGNGYAPQKSSPTYKEEVALRKSLEDKYNFKFDYFAIEHWGAYDEAYIKKTMAGEVMGDICFRDVALALPSGALKGQMLELDGIFDFNNPIFGKKINDSFLVRGKHYVAFPGEGLGNGTGIYFNKQLFKKYGVKTPYEYIKEGTWNWDNFLKTAQALTRDTNGDGKNDIWGIGAGGVTRSGLDPMSAVYSNGGRVTRTKNGKVTFALDEPAAIEGIQFAYDLQHKYNVVEPAGTDVEYGYWEKKWISGTIGMFCTEGYKITEFNKSMKNFGVGYAYLPKGPKAKDYVNATNPPVVMCMPPNVKNPKEVAQIMTELFAPQEWTLSQRQDFEMLYTDRDAVEVALGMSTRVVDDWYQNYTWLRDNVVWTDMGINAKTPPQTFINSVKQRAQKSIDDSWGLND